MKCTNNTIGSEYLLSFRCAYCVFNKIFKHRPYYAGIMLDAFGHLLCFKLCWHNRPVPTSYTIIILEALNTHEGAGTG